MPINAGADLADREGVVGSPIRPRFRQSEDDVTVGVNRYPPRSESLLSERVLGEQAVPHRFRAVKVTDEGGLDRGVDLPQPGQRLGQLQFQNWFGLYPGGQGGGRREFQPDGTAGQAVTESSVDGRLAGGQDRDRFRCRFVQAVQLGRHQVAENAAPDSRLRRNRRAGISRVTPGREADLNTSREEPAEPYGSSAR